MATLKVGNLDVEDRRLEFAHTYAWRDLSAIKQIIIHHDGTAFDENTLSLERLRMRATDHWHRKTQLWPGISYHFYVFPSGRSYYVGDILTVRFHTAGPDDPGTPALVSRWNEDGIAICLAGNFNEEPPGVVQLQATHELVDNLQNALDASTRGYLAVRGHREHSATSCPGNTWEDWRAAVTVEAPVGHAIEIDLREQALHKLWAIAEEFESQDIFVTESRQVVLAKEIKAAVRVLKGE